MAEVASLLRGLQPSSTWFIYAFELLCRRRVSRRQKWQKSDMVAFFGPWTTSRQTSNTGPMQKPTIIEKCKNYNAVTELGHCARYCLPGGCPSVHADSSNLTVWLIFWYIAQPNANTTDTYILSSPSGMKLYPRPLHLILSCNGPYPYLWPKSHREMSL